MGFKRLINSKKIVMLLSMFLLLGTNMLMAQEAATGTAATDLLIKALCG